MKRAYMISLIAFSVLACSSVAWAEGRYKTIEVFFDKINIKINGQQANLTKDSIIYDGSVYVPLKNLSELLGAEVSWDNANRSVNLDFITDRSNQVFNNA
ncbi:MAG: putative carbohydrate binding proteincopper amine oxidase family protein, partial [Paenibacillus sp.]|nr:putative carbohydrate binding proteincopper amine oxidase family protein [Paenibacillus sp.]